MPQPRIIRTARDEKVLSRFTIASTVDAVADLFPSFQTMYLRIGKLVRAGMLQRIERTEPSRTKPKDLYCSAPVAAKQTTLHPQDK